MDNPAQQEKATSYQVAIFVQVEERVLRPMPLALKY